MGWDYAIQWLTILPFEITAAGITIDFWKHYNIGVRCPIANLNSLLTILLDLDSCLPRYPYRRPVLWGAWIRRGRVFP